MKRLLPFVLAALLLAHPVEAGPVISGDDWFASRVSAAVQLVRSAGWGPYLDRNVGYVYQADDPRWGWNILSKDGGPGGAAFSLKWDPGTEWLAWALVHEAAHNEIARQGVKTCGVSGEFMADLVSQAFSIDAGIPFVVRDPHTIPEVDCTPKLGVMVSW